MRAPRTRFNRRIGAGRSAAFGSVSLGEIKAIKNAFGVTVNDVVMAVVAGALRRWLEERGELPDRPLVAVVPISGRASDDGNNFGNRIGMLFATLPTHEPDPRRRLESIRDEMHRAKRRYEAVPAMLLQDANNLVPPALFGRAARASIALGTQSLMTVGTNLLASNVPGSPVPLYMAGARLEAQYPVSAIFHNLALNITVLSYLDHMDWESCVPRTKTRGRCWRPYKPSTANSASSTTERVRALRRISTVVELDDDLSLERRDACRKLVPRIGLPRSHSLPACQHPVLARSVRHAWCRRVGDSRVMRRRNAVRGSV